MSPRRAAIATGTATAASVGPLQSRFQAALFRAQGDALPLARRRLERELLPSSTLTAAQRLNIYVHSYFLRLRDVLRHDFSGLRHALGEPEFDRLARRYVDACPSTSFTLNDFAARLPRFLARAPLPPKLHARRAFLVELATLERAVDELFHAPHAEPAAIEQLRALPPQRWAGARFTAIPAARLFAFRFPVNRYLQAVYDDSAPALPAATRNWLLVHRHDWKVWRSPLRQPQHALLRSLLRGAPLGDALQQAARYGGAAVLQEVGAWFSEWTGDGLFAAIDVRPTSPSRARSRRRGRNRAQPTG